VFSAIALACYSFIAGGSGEWRTPPASSFCEKEAVWMAEMEKTVLNDSGKRILAAGRRSSYDTEAINLIKDKQYLARILKDCTTEFMEMKIEDIILCIEDPLVGIVPVDPGLTNQVINGMLTESKVIREGVVTYDVRFFARNPRASRYETCEKINIRLLVDVETVVGDGRRHEIQTETCLSRIVRVGHIVEEPQAGISQSARL
jgi:hypothetical protein